MIHRQGISRRGFLGWTARAAAGLGAARACGFPGLSAAAQGEAREAPSAALRAIDAFAERHRREMGIPGMTLGLAGRDGLIAVRTYGHADVKAGLPVRPEQLFQIGSISKSFTALTLLQLRDEGKLDLHRPVREYLPWLRIESAYAPITPHHLLTHSSGLPRPLALPAMKLWTAHAPGGHFHYCNLGYHILGFLIEALDRRPLGDSLRARILRPLGMDASEPVISHQAWERLPVSYRPLYDDRPFYRHGPLTEAPYLVMDNAAGCVAATPADMALYMRMLLNQGRTPQGRLVSEESFALFQRPHLPAPGFGEGASYGYGIGVQPVEGRTVLRHTGGMVSFSSAMQVDLDAGFGAFASVNASLAGYRPNPVALYALAALRAEAAGKEPPPAPEPDDPYRVPQASGYAGTYTAPDGRKLVIAAEGDLLKLVHKGERVPLERIGADTFFASHPDFVLFPLSFERGSDRVRGEVAEVSHGGDWYAGERYAGPRTFGAPPELQACAGHYRSENAWEGSVRVVLRQGRLWAGGMPLVALAEGLFRLGEEEHAPDRVHFQDVIGGKARRAVFSGTEYRRVET